MVQKISERVCDMVAGGDRCLRWFRIGFMAISYLVMAWLVVFGFLAGYCDPLLGVGIALFCLALHAMDRV